MSIGDIIRSILELAAIVFVVWGLFHEDKFVRFEEKLFAQIRRKRFKVIKGNANFEKAISLPRRKSV